MTADDGDNRMILVDPETAGRYADDEIWGKATLDGLLSRAAGERPDEVALVDAAYELHSTARLARTLTWQELDERVSALAALFLDAGLRQDDVVAIQLANSAEAILAHLAAMRASLIPAALPLHWRRSELSAAAKRVAARALVTAVEIGPVPHAEIMRNVAFDTMSVRRVFAFGNEPPDGVEPLDHAVSGLASPEGSRGAPRLGNAADHIAGLVFAPLAATPCPLARSHNQMLAGAAMVVLSARLGRDAMLATMMAPTSFAGLASGVTAWLLAGCRLLLLTPDAGGYTLARREATHLVAPARLALALSPEVVETGVKLIRLWTDPLQLDSAMTNTRSEAVDLLSFADLALWAGDGPDRFAFPFMLVDDRTASAPQTELFAARMQGLVHRAGDALARGALLRGALFVGGPQVPSGIFPAPDGLPAGDLGPERDGMRATGLRCRLVEARPPRARISGFAGEVYMFGGIPMRTEALDVLYANLPGVADAAVIATPDPLFGHRIAAAVVAEGNSMCSPDAIRAALEARGMSPCLVPDRVVTVAEIPRSSDGTVLRGALERRCAA